VKFVAIFVLISN